MITSPKKAPRVRMAPAREHTPLAMIVRQSFVEIFSPGA